MTAKADGLSADAGGENVIAHPVAWIERNFYIPETRGPIILYPSQRVPLQQALKRDEDGQFLYSLVLWGAIKKSAKSSIAAAVGLWFAFRQDYSAVKVIANDQKQAESRVYYYMRRALELHDKLGGDLAGRGRVNRNKILLDNGSFIEALPIDPKGEAGGNDDLVIYSEIWGWKTHAAKQMWTESTLSPLKFGQSMRWAETYAGHLGDSPVLENLYASGVMDGQQPSQAWRDYEMYHTPDVRQFSLWTTRPTLPWQTEDYYAQERASLDSSEFDRVHRNQWTTFAGLVYPDFNDDNVSDLAEYDPAKGPLYWACDDGYAIGEGPGSASYHPRCILLAQENEFGGLDFFAEYEQAGVSTYAATINAVAEYGYPPPEAAYVDSAAAMFRGVLRNDFQIHAYASTHSVFEGVKQVRRLICDANGVRLLRFHPRCKSTIGSMKRLRFATTGTAQGGEMKIMKIDDHLPDCVRYLCWAKRNG